MVKKSPLNVGAARLIGTRETCCLRSADDNQ